MSIDGDFEVDDFGDIIDQNLFKLAKKNNKKENFDWENDDIEENIKDRLAKGTAMIRAYLDLSSLWSMVVSLIYLTCFIAIFFLLDLFYIEDSNGTRSPKRKRFVNRLKNIVSKSYSDAALIVRNSSDTKRLAKLIFEYLRPSDEAKFLTLNDFIPFFSNQDQAQRAFNIFDVDRNGDISKFEIINIIISIYKEKDDIEKSMRDSGLALKKLNLIMKFLSIIIIGLIGMAMLTEGYSIVMISLGTVWASTLFAISGIITMLKILFSYSFLIHLMLEIESKLVEMLYMLQNLVL
ncbi:hypothetical protein H8356DRAFT_1409351 [Neocallimastix lanati (nom. inval.)]|nr:hypothetical protein H8356DRAFT_1409351 [Neocallimastix sp. JGI-2020a]